MQTVIGLYFRTRVLKKDAAFFDDLTGECLAPGSLGFRIFRPTNGASINDIESSARCVLHVDGYIIENEFLTQGSHKLLKRVARISSLRRNLHQFLQVSERGIIHCFYLDSATASNGNLNVEPRPSIDSTSSIEPCASIICRTRESPSPVPPYLRVADPSS